MDHSPKPIEERLRWQVIIVRQRIDANEQEESFSMFSHPHRAKSFYDIQWVELYLDAGLEGWLIAFQDSRYAVTLETDSRNPEILHFDKPG